MTSRTSLTRRRSRALPASIAVALLVLTAQASGAVDEIVPGVTYERRASSNQVTHVIRVTPGPRINVHPALTRGVTSKRGLLTAAMRARLGKGAVAGINADYFNLNSAYPSGVLLNAGELISEPEATRSALFFPAAGALTTGLIELKGTWQASDPAIPAGFPERTFIGMNRPAETATETLVYTPRYGAATPTGNVVDALIDLDPPGDIAVNRPLTGTVQFIKPGGGSGVGAGKLVLSGVGAAADRILSDLAVGRRVTLNFAIAGIPADAVHAIGGGPALVTGGTPITSVSEGFSSGQAGSRTSRSAIGQTASGTILLVTSEGPSQGRTGYSMVGHAQVMAALGAVTAFGLDGGGSAIMTVRDRLVIPWRSERAITDAVMVDYNGVQITPPATLVSPNGDGVADGTTAVARAPGAGKVRITLTRDNGATVRRLYSGVLGPSGRTLPLRGANLPLKDGRYRVTAKYSANDGSGTTTQTRTIVVDRSLGFLKLRKSGAANKVRLKIGFRLARTARVTIVVKNAKGSAVKVILRDRRIRAGDRGVTWDMKRKGKPLPPGIYTVAVSVRTPYGPHGPSGRFRATKVKPAAPAPPAA